MKFKFFLLTFLLLGLTMSCDKEEEVRPLYSCGNFFELSADSKTCDCPAETHYMLQEEGLDSLRSVRNIIGRLCMEKGDYVYKAKFSANSCIGKLDNEFFELERVGIVRIWGGLGTSFGFLVNYANGSSGRFADNSPKEFKRLADGRLEMTFKTFLFPTHHDCWPEAIDETGIVTGYGYGISNVDNTEMEIEIVYKNRHGTVFNTTNLYLWK